MSNCPPDCDIWTAAAFLHLERALYGEGAACRSRKGFFISLILHSFPALLVFPGFSAGDEVREAKSLQTAVPIFVPAVTEYAHVLHNTPYPTLGQLLPPVLQLPVGGNPDLTVDLSAIQLSFADDVQNQLPTVVRAQHGQLMLLDKEDRSIARYIFQPPGWEVHEVITDISSQLRILMDPPEKWALLRRLAERYGIALENYQASAVFDVSYGRCLQAAIRRHAQLASTASGARVSAARLAFANDMPCGVEVLEVSLAAQPTH